MDGICSYLRLVIIDTRRSAHGLLSLSLVVCITQSIELGESLKINLELLIRDVFGDG